MKVIQLEKEEQKPEIDAQLLRLYTALCLANNNWPNDPENIELLRIVNQAIMQKVGL